jgi:hypothetical protein
MGKMLIEALKYGRIALAKSIAHGNNPVPGANIVHNIHEGSGYSGSGSAPDAESFPALSQSKLLSAFYCVNYPRMSTCY